MRKHRIRTAAIAATTLAGALSLAACAGGASAAGGAAPAPSAVGSASASPAAPAAPSAHGGGTRTAQPSAGHDKVRTGTPVGDRDKSGYPGKVCRAKDITWSTRSEDQAGGYILISAKAHRGITCTLPAGLPTVAFGSDGTTAGPAEQVAGDAVTLKGDITVYAGVNPKTANTKHGKELDSIIVAVGNEDPDPVSLKVGTILVDRPVVTDWHTDAKDAVPFS
ncbi:hypothetical protein LKL35_04055 [Streptomyces sp. ET3-23]|uniref:hypothetical protein n=1 Tax=Streptomyces sp. ET3-23 TaxID=2885643 RepID=UPI001D123543|nr:hypothetical protein [Streptomyces sp. ET3-23]MCC2274614.1 hypothetical protein [Streptomyces sp. ET3-23]